MSANIRTEAIWRVPQPLRWTAFLLFLFAAPSAVFSQEPPAFVSAWDSLQKAGHPLIQTATRLERDLLQRLTLEQARAYGGGVAPGNIQLATGESLSAFFHRKGLASFDLSWFSIDSGSPRMTGGAFALQGVVGQLEAGTLAGGAFILSGGFLGPNADDPPEDPCVEAIFCDGFESGNLGMWSDTN